MNMAIHRDAFAVDPNARPQATGANAASVAAAARPAKRMGAHVFDLHPALHIGVFVGFFAYLGVMWSAFGEAALAIPFVIFAVFLAAAFIVPAWWARVAPGEGEKPSFSQFLSKGMQTETGHSDANGAMVQVMIMPAMLVAWGIIVATIRFSL